MKQTRKTTTTFTEHRFRRDREVAYGEPCKSVHEERTITLTSNLTLELDFDLLFQPYADYKFDGLQHQRAYTVDMRTAKRMLQAAKFKASCGPITRTEGEWKIVSMSDTFEFSEEARRRCGLSWEEAKPIWLACHQRSKDS